METKTIETDLGKVEYSRIGEGMPILYIHGGHSNCRELLFQKGFDTSQFCLITPCRPGYGKTILEGFESPKEAAILIKAFLDKIGIGQVTVIGISAGGPTAIEFASSFPERIQQLLLISAVSKKWMTPNDDLYKTGKRIFAPKIERFSWAMTRFFFGLFPKLMTTIFYKEFSSAKRKDITKDEIEELKEMISNLRSHIGFVNDLDQEIEKDSIEKITCPTLILHSKNDNSVHIDFANHAHEKITNSILKIYDNKWGHLLWLGEESATPIQDAVEFIKGVNESQN